MSLIGKIVSSGAKDETVGYFAFGGGTGGDFGHAGLGVLLNGFRLIITEPFPAGNTLTITDSLGNTLVKDHLIDISRTDYYDLIPVGQIYFEEVNFTATFNGSNPVEVGELFIKPILERYI